MTDTEYSVFVCLMASYTAEGAVFTKVCRASNLARNLARHNRESKRTDRDTYAGAPYWEYVLVIGPMKKGHRALAANWRAAGKTLEKLVYRGMLIGRRLSQRLKRSVLFYG